MMKQVYVTNALTAYGEKNWQIAHDNALIGWQENPHDMALALLLGASLLQLGHKESALALLSTCADQNPIIRIAQYNNSIDARLRTASQLADREIRKKFTQLQDHVIAQQKNAGRITSAIWPQTHSGPVKYPDNSLGPKPHMFYVPDLPHTEIFDTQNIDWVQSLNAHCDNIRKEYLAAMAINADVGAPYVSAQSQLGPEWQTLKGQKSWNSVHLYKDGVPQEAAENFPRTLSALSSAPLVLQNGNPMEVFFSILAPGVTIPAHFGLANCRVTAHLPLIIPKTTRSKDCAICVGETQHIWQKGETMLFDDSFEHSAWNKTKDSRVVLIFEAWRPDMTQGEIKAVEASYSARSNWLNNRPNLIEKLKTT
ncbi:MAG: aspartyl/asparaginyl beta-hydroxylase domain-containing protein [Maricaulaceae bacterium]